MNVSRVRLRNFRSYAALDLELPDGATALIGPNGAGKSSILAAIDVALFGATSLEPFLRHGERQLEVTIEVEHGGSNYRIRRGLSGARSSLDFEEERGSGVWEALAHETQKATQKLIEGTLGLTRETFRASAYLMQGDAGAITNARPAERMAILRDTIGGLELYDDAHEYAKRLLTSARADLADLAGRVAMLLEAAAELPAAREEEASLARDVVALEGERADAEEQRVAVAEELQRGRELVAERERLLEQARVASAQLEQLEGQARSAADAVIERTTLEERLRWLEADSALEAERDTLVQTLERHAQLSQQRAELFGRARDTEEAGLLLQRQAERDESLGAGASRCGECGQLLGDEALQSSLASRRARADALLGRRDALLAQANALELPELPEPLPDLADARAELEDARLARERTVAVRTRLGVLEVLTRAPESDAIEQARERAQAARELAEEAATIGVSGPERRLNELNVAAAQLEQRLTARRRSHAHAEQRRTTLEEQAARAKATEARRANAERAVRVRELAAAMFAPTGIPLLVIENVVPAIELRAQQVLERLGGETAGCVLELRTQRANKGDGQLRDTLDILIHAPSGETLAYEHWSGGEKMRLDLALRVGLAQLLLAQGANVELFAVDEPDGLDAQGRAALAEMVEEMGDRFGFRKVLLISHDESLRDSFAQTLEVARPDGGPSEVAA